jgi:hypothetical protein
VVASIDVDLLPIYDGQQVPLNASIRTTTAGDLPDKCDLAPHQPSLRPRSLGIGSRVKTNFMRQFNTIIPVQPFLQNILLSFFQN